MRSTQSPVREPRVFEPDDPALIAELEPRGAPSPADQSGTREADATVQAAAASRWRGVPWGAVLGSSLMGLLTLALGVWMSRFAAEALARDDALGWMALALVAIASIAAGAIVLREVAGLARLRRLEHLRRALAAALDARDAAQERRQLRALIGSYATREDLRWSIARLRDHEADVRDAGELARLADREIFLPLDRRAKRIVLASAKRVSMVTAISPAPLIDVVFVLVENLRMLRGVATLYGGRPGILSALRLGRMVLTHLIATGGLALTDDLLGQVLGHDLLRRLSRRLGEGAFNGAMTVRIGAAAIHVIRPLPFLDATPVRARDFLAELFRSAPGALRKKP